MQNLSVTIIQSILHWEDIDANLKMFSEKISSIKEKTNLIILPEMFSTGFTMNAKKLAEPMNGRTMQWMKEMAKKKNCVITGSIIIQEKKKFYNRLIWMLPNGKFKIYDKRHLFRYANEQKYYSAGEKKLLVDLNGWKICPLICYDLRFPVWCRNSSFGGVRGLYDVLIFIANWPEKRNHQWKTLLMARAIENQCYVIGVNRVGNDGNNIYHSGDSAVIDFKGENISKTRPHEESVETITLSKKELNQWRKIFPAWKDEDEFQICS
jgi:predicted amidohydrolase